MSIFGNAVVDIFFLIILFVVVRHFLRRSNRFLVRHMSQVLGFSALGFVMVLISHPAMTNGVF